MTRRKSARRQRRRRDAPAARRCILGEMLGGKPVFPGTSTVNQLEKVLELTGQPSAEDIRSAGSQYAERMLESIGPVAKRELALGGSEPTGPSLLHACLKFNPSLRCTAVQALEDPFVAEFHKSEEEPDFPNGARQRSDLDGAALHIHPRRPGQDSGRRQHEAHGRGLPEQLVHADPADQARGQGPGGQGCPGARAGQGGRVRALRVVLLALCPGRASRRRRCSESRMGSVLLRC